MVTPRMYCLSLGRCGATALGCGRCRRDERGTTASTAGPARPLGACATPARRFAFRPRLRQHPQMGGDVGSVATSGSNPHPCVKGENDGGRDSGTAHAGAPARTDDTGMRWVARRLNSALNSTDNQHNLVAAGPIVPLPPVPSATARMPPRESACTTHPSVTQ